MKHSQEHPCGFAVRFEITPPGTDSVGKWNGVGRSDIFELFSQQTIFPDE